MAKGLCRHWKACLLVFICTSSVLSGASVAEVRENLARSEEKHITQQHKGSNGIPVTYEDYFVQEFDKPDYVPRLEVIGAHLFYDNATATLQVSVHVGIPKNISGQKDTAAVEQTENFTNYEFYLTAMMDDETSEPPKSCSSDLFLQHSFLDVVVGCPPPGNRHPLTSEITLPNNATSLGSAVRRLETSCIDPGTTNFTVKFRHVYSAYYCLLIQPRVGTHTRRTFARLVRYRTIQTPVDLTKWQTVVDLQPLIPSQSFLVAFTVPDPSYEFASGKFQIDLLQVTTNNCNRNDQIRKSWRKCVSAGGEKQSVEVEFNSKPPGYYCVVVTPVDERCDGNNYWKAKGGSCARHTSKPVRLQAPYHNLKPGTQPEWPTVMMTTTNSRDVWATVTVVCSLVFGVVIVFLVAVIAFKHRCHNKRLLQQQHQLLLKWGHAAVVVGADATIGDVEIKPVLPRGIVAKNNADSGPLEPVLLDRLLTMPSTAASSYAFSVLLLYRRDDQQVSTRAAELRKRLRAECCGQLKVFDYGDESQWDEIATEGVDWLPNRILYGVA